MKKPFLKSSDITDIAMLAALLTVAGAGISDFGTFGCGYLLRFWVQEIYFGGNFIQCYQPGTGHS